MNEQSKQAARPDTVAPDHSSAQVVAYEPDADLPAVAKSDPQFAEAFDLWCVRVYALHADRAGVGVSWPDVAVGFLICYGFSLDEAADLAAQLPMPDGSAPAFTKGGQDGAL